LSTWHAPTIAQTIGGAGVPAEPEMQRIYLPLVVKNYL
jgi:hypothetical protein